MAGGDRPLSKNGSILVGLLVAAAGVGIVALSVFARPEGLHAPRWVVACAGGAFVFFGGWTAGIYAAGFDPQRPVESLPSPWIQLAVFLPGLLMFAAPFHWVAFGPGPRQFSSSVSLPFLTVRGGSGAWTGRALFGFGALLIDAMLVGTVFKLGRQIRRGAVSPASPGSAIDPR